MIRKIESFRARRPSVGEISSRLERPPAWVSAASWIRLSTSGTALAQVSPADAIQWNYEADIVVIGAGCTGLPAAIRARDLGASVIVVDQNFDLGGKMLHSGGTGFSGRRGSAPAEGHQRRRRQGGVRHRATAAFAWRN